MLTIVWSDNERQDVKLYITGRQRKLPPSGAIRYELPAGRHRLTIQREGFVPIDEVLEVTEGQQLEFEPPWKPLVTTPPPESKVSSSKNSRRKPPRGGSKPRK